MVIFFLLEIENNPETGCYLVGRGGFPNANGVLEGDAAVMVGKDCSFGAVAALQGYNKNYTFYRFVLQDEGTTGGWVGTQAPWF